MFLYLLLSLFGSANVLVSTLQTTHHKSNLVRRLLQSNPSCEDVTLKNRLICQKISFDCLSDSNLLNNQFDGFSFGVNDFVVSNNDSNIRNLKSSPNIANITQININLQKVRWISFGYAANNAGYASVCRISDNSAGETNPCDSIWISKTTRDYQPGVYNRYYSTIFNVPNFDDTDNITSILFPNHNFILIDDFEFCFDASADAAIPNAIINDNIGCTDGVYTTQLLCESIDFDCFNGNNIGIDWIGRVLFNDSVILNENSTNYVIKNIPSTPNVINASSINFPQRVSSFNFLYSVLNVSSNDLFGRCAGLGIQNAVGYCDGAPGIFNNPTDEIYENWSVFGSSGYNRGNLWNWATFHTSKPTLIDSVNYCYFDSSTPSPTPPPTTTTTKSPTKSPTISPYTKCKNIAGGGWTLYRHAPANIWHQSTDNLMGTDSYGNMSLSNVENNYDASFQWSMQWNATFGTNAEFLFATSDCSEWLVTHYVDIYAGYPYNDTLKYSHNDSRTHNVNCWKWMFRSPFTLGQQNEDPQITIGDHFDIMNRSLLYVENSFVRSYQSTLGMNVWIRNNSLYTNSNRVQCPLVTNGR